MKTRILLTLITLLFATLLNSPRAHAATHTYDIAADFSGVENPNCVWSYGWSQSRGSTFNLATTPGQDNSSGTVIGWELFGGIIPAYAVTDYYLSTVFIPQGTVNLHPGPLGENSVVRWTAPSAGSCTIQGWFKGNDFAHPTSTDVAILHGATEIFSGAINSYDVPLNFSLTVQVNAGDTIDFAVGYGSNGNYFGDSTGINAAISHDSVEPPPSCAVPICTPPPANMVSWWPGDGNAFDIQDGHDGTVQGGVTFAAGRVDQAFSFDGATGYVDIGDALDVNSGAMTVEAWIKGDPTMEEWGRIIDKGYSTGWCFGRMASTNKVGFEFLASGSQGNGFSTTSDVIDNTWHHVAVVVENGVATIYADGSAENSETVSTDNQDNSLPLLIGYNPGEGTQGHWKGMIDELSFYDRALSGSEILAIYSAGAAGKCRAPSCTAQVQPPINEDGSSIFNAKRGVIPVKFRLNCDGNSTCDLAPATIAVTRTAGGVIGAINESVYSSQADSGPNFRITDCQYHYNLNSGALGVGTYRVDILINGQVVGSSTFQLR